MKYYGDYHTHSRYSDGREQVESIAEAARWRGLSEVAVTDHGPRLLVLGVDGLSRYERSSRRLCLNIPEVRVLAGAEASP